MNHLEGIRRSFLLLSDTAVMFNAALVAAWLGLRWAFAGFTAGQRPG